jgi:site-specific recombinase XerC
MKTWPTVRPRKQTIPGKQDRLDWCVDAGKIAGKRVVRFFPSKAQADSFATQLRIEREQLGEMAFSLTPENKRDAVMALHKLDGKTTLCDAVTFWLSRNNTSGTSVRVVQDQLIQAQTTRKNRKASIDATRTQYQGFIQNYGECHVADITTPMLENWIQSVTFGQSDATKANVLRYLSVFFNFAIKKGYIKDNPITPIERPRLTRKVPEFLTVNQVTDILRYAQSTDPGMVRRLAIGFFAGIRPEELKRLPDSSVNIATGLITVPAEVAKCGIPRHVEMSENLKSWLSAYPAIDFTNNFDERRKEICKKTGTVAHWPHDAMRHTYATHHLATHKDAAKTSFELGHTQGTKLLFRHYAGLVTAQQAQEYWKIIP